MASAPAVPTAELPEKGRTVVRRVIVDKDGWQLMWVKHGTDKHGAALREWKAASITDEMIQRAADRVGETWQDNMMPGEVALAVLIAALNPDALREESDHG